MANNYYSLIAISINNKIIQDEQKALPENCGVDKPQNCNKSMLKKALLRAVLNLSLMFGLIVTFWILLDNPAWLESLPENYGGAVRVVLISVAIGLITIAERCFGVPVSLWNVVVHLLSGGF